MGLIGRTIDGLSAEEKDRLIEWPEFLGGGSRNDDGEGGCLIMACTPQLAWCASPMCKVQDWYRKKSGPSLPARYAGTPIFVKFDMLLVRHGQRLSRAIKLRAAKGNKIDLGARLDQDTPLVQESEVAT